MEINVGLLGCGVIGRALGEAIDQGKAGTSKLTIVYDVVPENAKDLARSLVSKPLVAQSAMEVLNNEQVNLVIEAANQTAVREFIPRAVENRKNVMVMSVGAFTDENLFLQVTSLARQNGVRVYIPSGAIGGLDALKAAASAGLDEVSITSIKPPNALEGAPYIVQNKIDLNGLKERKLVYEGTAFEAASLFPANVNVAVALSLAGIGAKRTKTMVVADPSASNNSHEIFAKGAFGTMTVKVDNVQSPTNPKSSWLAALSAVRKIREISETVSLGT